MTCELTVLAIFFSGKQWDVTGNPGLNIVTTEDDGKVCSDVYGAGLGPETSEWGCHCTEQIFHLFELLPHRPAVMSWLMLLMPHIVHFTEDPFIQSSKKDWNLK